MAPEDDGVRIDERIRAEWPAALAVLILVAGHLYLTVVAGQELTPLGIPLLLAIVAFLAAEIGRRLV